MTCTLHLNKLPQRSENIWSRSPFGALYLTFLLFYKLLHELQNLLSTDLSTHNLFTMHLWPRFCVEAKQYFSCRWFRVFLAISLDWGGHQQHFLFSLLFIIAMLWYVVAYQFSYMDDRAIYVSRRKSFVGWDECCCWKSLYLWMWLMIELCFQWTGVGARGQTRQTRAATTRQNEYRW